LILDSATTSRRPPPMDIGGGRRMHGPGFNRNQRDSYLKKMSFN